MKLHIRRRVFCIDVIVYVYELSVSQFIIPFVCSFCVICFKNRLHVGMHHIKRLLFKLRTRYLFSCRTRKRVTFGTHSCLDTVE